MFGYLMSLTYQKFWNLSSSSPRPVMMTDFNKTIIVVKQIYNNYSMAMFIKIWKKKMLAFNLIFKCLRFFSFSLLWQIKLHSKRLSVPRKKSVSMTTSASLGKTSAFSGHLTPGVAPKDYVAAMSRLPAEVTYWTNSKSFGQCHSFTHPNI